MPDARWTRQPVGSTEIPEKLCDLLVLQVPTRAITESTALSALPSSAERSRAGRNLGGIVMLYEKKYHGTDDFWTLTTHPRSQSGIDCELVRQREWKMADASRTLIIQD